MPKNEGKKRVKYQNHDAFVKILADKHALSPRHIRRIRDGERSNDMVFSDYMFLQEGWNDLVAEVKKLIPFPQKSPKPNN